MSDSQKGILQQTTQLIRPFSWKSFLLNGTISSALVILLIWLLTQSFDGLFWTVMVVLTFVYLFFRDIFLQSRLKKQISVQYSYTLEKRPDTVLYLPLFDPTRGMLVLKHAALVFLPDTCGLITFKQSPLVLTPADAIFVPLGKDFLLESYEDPQDKPYFLLKINLMGTVFRIGVIKNPEIESRIKSIIDVKEKDV